MRILVFYGKGGIGKSTVVSNLSVLFAAGGKRVLQFGCDPKSDSCYSLVEGPVATVMERWLELGDADLSLQRCLLPGCHGVDCIEVGGPVAGTGCGGRGITKALELVGDPEALRSRYDVILFDVLGDVVCGGFSAPMRSRYGDEVYIVTSGEFRSLYAANNISQAVRHYSRNGVRLAGLVANLRGLERETERVEQLARAIGTRVVHAIPQDPEVARAELDRVPVVDSNPSCPAAVAMRELGEKIAALSPEDLSVPKPLPRSELDRMFLTTRIGHRNVR
jgi:nitrogenase iron protein NifH